MKASELKRKSAQELTKEILDLRREAFNLRMQVGSGQSVRTDRFRAIRRAIARIKTVQRQSSHQVSA